MSPRNLVAPDESEQGRVLVGERVQALTRATAPGQSRLPEGGHRL